MGTTLTKPQEESLDRYVKDLHGVANTSYATIDIFNRFDYLYPFLGGNSAAHALNLVNPAMYPMTWNGSPTQSANGVDFNGVNQWGNTGFNVNGRTSNDRHWSMYSDNPSSIAGWNFGVWQGITGQTAGAAIYNGQVLRYFGLNDYASTVTAINKMSAANLNGTSTIIYSNGGSVLTRTNTKTSPTGNMYLGMLNDVVGSNAAMYGTAFRCKMFSFGASLSPTEHAALAAATNALQTALSRA